MNGFPFDTSQDSVNPIPHCESSHMGLRDRAKLSTVIHAYCAVLECTNTAMGSNAFPKLSGTESKISTTETFMNNRLYALSASSAWTPMKNVPILLT